MRGIGWLSIVREALPTTEILNDLRFLKRTTAAGIVARSMEDADLCDVYNYEFVGCGDPLDVTGAINTIWSIVTLDEPGETFTIDRPPESGPINYDEGAVDIQIALEAIYGGGNVNVVGGPLNDAPVFVEFIGGFAGTNVPFALGTFTGTEPVLTQVQVGAPAVPAAPSFGAIDWEDDDPWFDGGASLGAAEFRGIWTENWEGLEGEFDRTANARGWSFGGANFTPLRPRHLAMTFEVILGATTERGLQYGFRWLSATLRGLDNCDRSELVVFDHCPPVGTPQSEWTWWMIRDAGVLDMPRWGEMLMETKNCILRRVTFVLGARDPHKYRCPTLCSGPVTYEGELIPAPATVCAPDYSWSEWFCHDSITDVCCDIVAPPFDYTSRAAVAHIVAGADGAPPMEISWDDGFLTETFRTTTLPAFTHLVIDSSRHRILSYPGGLSSPPVDGSQFVAAATGLAPVWAEVGPLDADGEICVRPLRICGLEGTQIYIETVDRV